MRIKKVIPAESGYSRLKRKIRSDAVVRSQLGALDKFVVKKARNLVGSSSAENEGAHDVGNENVIDETVDVCDDVNHMDLRDILVENDPYRNYLLNKGPRNKHRRRFRSTFYDRYLTNGEIEDRKWLVYSEELDKIFCFCCKLFKKGPHQSGLVNEEYDDWGHAHVALSKHEITREHWDNMEAWYQLCVRLGSNKTIDKHVQERIKIEKEHWQNVLQQIISVVKCLAKHTLAFRGRMRRFIKVIMEIS
ncbi:zinc finger MYM-type protein 5-like [Papaver somniferum]|uniref:zinc finger MYM-type protein 5-like n=1 Tax=Papaver somniferum TaxID=3469 RepID=UPI000E6F7FC7|nr:zinc finger MYM-type protein 5-like [Papaver somniferum]